MSDKETKTNKKQSSQRSKFKLDEIEVKSTELGYVTAIHYPTRTFFVQLCKNSVEELISFTDALNDYSNEQFKLINKEIKVNVNDENCGDDNNKQQSNIEESRINEDSDDVRKENDAEIGTNNKNNLQKIHTGDIVCVRFSDEDPQWYRALVLKKGDNKRDFHLLYLDYGDVQITSTKRIFVPDAKKFPLIKRAAFGITCFLEGAENLAEDEGVRLLDTLKNKYIMIKIIGNEGRLQHLVTIPSNAYNLPFWVQYAPDKYRLNSSDPAQNTKKIKFGAGGDVVKSSELVDLEEQKQSE